MICKRKDKEQWIIKSAMFVFSEKGFTKSSIQDIAEKANIGKGTIYEYFNSKDELFIEGYKLVVGEFVEAIQEVVSGPDEFYQKLDTFITVIQNITEEKGKKIKFLLHDSLNDLKPDSRKKLESIHLEMKQHVLLLFSDVLETGIAEGKVRTLDVSFASRALVGFTFVLPMINGSLGICNNEVASTNQKDIERRLLMDLIFNGIIK